MPHVYIYTCADVGKPYGVAWGTGWFWFWSLVSNSAPDTGRVSFGLPVRLTIGILRLCVACLIDSRWQCPHCWHGELGF